MKSARDVKAVFRDATIGTHPAGDRAVLMDAFQAGGLTRQMRPAGGERTICGVLMGNQKTTLAAAILILTAVLGIRYFEGTAVKAVEYPEIVDAMQQTRWMHATVAGFELGPGECDEHWVDFKSRTQATRRASGSAVFMSEEDRRQWAYDPNSNVITVTRLEAFPIDIASPEMMLATLKAVYEQDDAQVVVKMGIHQDRRVQIQHIAPSKTSPDGGSHSLILYVDPDSKLLYRAETKVVDSSGNVVGSGTCTYDYPASGPRSIYDLSVPADAQQLDRTPPTDFAAVREEYRRCKTEAAGEYIAVIVHQERSPSDVVRMLAVEYRSGLKERYERHFLSPRGETIAELAEQPVDNLEPLLAWARRRHEDPHAMITIQLYDGQYSSSIDRDGSGWGKLQKAYSPNGDSDLSQTMAFQAWPTIPSTARIIADDYAQQNGLICIENLTQGIVFPNGAVGHPGRFLYYLDPARDYLCRRQVMEWRPNAEWQQDKNWLKRADPQKVRGGGMVAHEITEVFHASNGHWYPRVIVQKQTDTREDYKDAPMNVCDVETVYLDVSPTFPEGIFDRDRLPGK